MLKAKLLPVGHFLSGVLDLDDEVVGINDHPKIQYSKIIMKKST